MGAMAEPSRHCGRPTGVPGIPAIPAIAAISSVSRGAGVVLPPPAPPSPPRRRSRLPLTLLTLLAAGCGDRDTPRRERFVPPLEANLLVISVDTTRADHLGCYGYDRPTSPRIDALARSGQRFERAFTVMPTTLPAHSAMLTSQYPRQLGVLSNLGTLPEGEHTLAERLAEAGFATGAFVSARVLGPDTHIAQGFETYVHPTNQDWRANHVRESARLWIGEHARERFFCFVHMYDPHVPYDPPRGQRQAFGVEAEEGLPPLGQIAFMLEPEGLNPELVQDAIRAYDAELAFADGQIGKLMGDLRTLGLFERTVVVILSDHGETLDELAQEYGYAFDHGEFLYPRELLIPFVLRAPAAFGFASGTAIDAPVSLLDLMPTALELLGVDCAPPYEGRSLVGLLQGGEVPDALIVAQRHSYVEPPNPWMMGDERALVHLPWLSIHSDGRGTELLQLDRQGAAALEDLSAREPDLLERLRGALERWLSAHPPKADRLDPEAPDSERDKMLRESGYVDGG